MECPNTFTLDEKNLFEYALEEVKNNGIVLPRSPMDQATYMSMSKDKRMAFQYCMGQQLEKYGWR